MPVSIRSRLLLLVLSVLLPGVAAALWIICQTYDTEQQALERHLTDTTRALSMVVDRELAQRASIARMLATSRNLDDAPEVTPEQLTRFEQQARQAMQGLAGSVTLTSAAGRLLDTRLPAGVRPPSTVGNTPPATLADVALIGSLEPAADGGAQHANVVQPVQRDGRTVLNVAVSVEPGELQTVIDQQGLPAEWLAEVIDPKGTVAARHPGSIAQTGQATEFDFKPAPGASAATGGDATGGGAVFKIVSHDGKAVTAYVSTTPQGWRFVSAVPRPPLAGLLPPAVAQVVLGSLVLLAVAVGGALWVARRIALPVHTLKQAAVQMRAGEPVAVAATGLVECDEVGAALVGASDALQRARDDLERQVADAVKRTRLAEQRASRSQHIEALGRLTGGVAHDFNNLLGVISNSMHLIRRQATSPELNLAVAASLRAVEAGSRLTQHLLRFAGRQEVRPQAIDLGRALPDLTELIQTVLGPRIKLTVAVAPNTRRVIVDVNELELALTNLALNARDAMPAGGHLRVQARHAHGDEVPDLPAGDYVLITVSDDGVGLEDDVADRVFEPFFTTKAVGQGTGLSLAQVLGFCVQAGGTARLTSTVGLGTTVSMLLPTTAEPVGLTPLADVPMPPVTPEMPSMAGARVLLVEDNLELADVTSTLLESLGCRVEQASSAQAALRMIDTGAAFDVVLSDVMMGNGMNGVGLARALRERQPDLPVVLISGYTSPWTSTDDFVLLHKPCAPERLVSALNEAVEGALLNR